MKRLFTAVILVGLAAVTATPAVAVATPPVDELRVVKVRSGDVAGLAAAVADPANTNTLIDLEPGVYRLASPLRLQPNQFLRGTNRYQFSGGSPAPRPGGGYADPGSETILDCAAVTGLGCVFIREGGLTALTVSGGRAGALVQVGGAGLPPPYDVRLRRVDLAGGERAFRMQVGAGHGSATIEQSVLRDTSGFFSFGWQLQISGAATSGASIEATIANSTVTGHKFGGGVAGLGSGATFAVTSHANSYVGNGAGLVLHPARDATAGLGGTAPGVHGNRLTFLSESDSFVRNGTYNDFYWPYLGGIVATTALRQGPNSGPHSNNAMDLTVKDPRFTDNAVADLLAYAAVSLDGGFPQGLPSTEPAGVGNVLDLTLDVGAHTGVFLGCASIPTDPTGTNSLLVDGGAVTPNCGALP
jgi:hypothetical protein